MKAATDSPAVLETDTWIEAADGCRLFARLRRPASEELVPVVLKATPFGIPNETLMREFPARGIASLELDLRGFHNSEGLPQDEYALREQEDLLEVIDWLAQQPWCSGRVGMRGISWSGFNALQVAARRPAALAAIVSGCSTDDRYADDMHYTGGVPIADGGLSWAHMFMRVQASAPEPAAVGESWLAHWQERLERVEPPLATWLAHQRRDDYWRHGSICEDYGAIQCPVLLFGGWMDGYPSPLFRMLENIDRSWAIVGPWGHQFPYSGGKPGPGISAEYEIEWWEHWLTDADNGAEQAPRLRAYIRDPRPPVPTPDREPGRWAAIAEWPTGGEPHTIDLTAGMLNLPPESADRISFLAPQTTGFEAAPSWLPMGTHDRGGEQRGDDGRSLCFTTAPLTQPLETLGIPRLRLAVSVDKPVAHITARLCDVHPDGTSRLLSIGTLNLTHRNSRSDPTPVTPGKRMDVEIPLRAIGQRIPVGHHLRVAITSGYWPWVWPSPEPATITLHFDAGNQLVLPALPSDAQETELCPPPAEREENMGDPIAAAAAGPQKTRTISIDPESGGVRTRTESEFISRDGDELLNRSHSVNEFFLEPLDPLSAEATCLSETAWKQDGALCSLCLASTLTSTAEAFLHTVRLTAHLDEQELTDREFAYTIPRDFC